MITPPQVYRNDANCTYGCGGIMFLNQIENEPHWSKLGFDLKCNKCSQEDLVFVAKENAGKMIYQQWNKQYDEANK